MPKQIQDPEQVSDGVNLLISILVRYPEIGSVSFEPEKNSLKLTFLLSYIPVQTEFDSVRQLLLDSISAFHILDETQTEIADVQLTTCEQVALLSIFRDIHTLSKSEIALIITLLHDKFRNRLVSDYNDSLLEEDLLMQEDVIEDMLANIKQQLSGKGLIGIREDGRVLVFNK
jgi:hypothetical protein